MKVLFWSLSVIKETNIWLTTYIQITFMNMKVAML